ncbi:MAG TPA: MAPEG family protein [Burkholderiales bacterium]|nr:MAPEG family protein [Burkholderiales bacterium]
MKPELMLLVWAVALMFVQMLVAATGTYLQVGLTKMAGNRDDMPKMAGWAGRAERAHLNMLENIALFAPLVLVAVLAGKTNAMTLLGAQIFVWARVAYAVIYLAGVIWLRTLVWAVSVVGLVIIFAQLVK